jgi:hypothetical protein
MYVVRRKRRAEDGGLSKDSTNDEGGGQSHVKQMRIDDNGNRLLDEVVLGVFNASTPFELLTAPDVSRSQSCSWS